MIKLLFHPQVFLWLIIILFALSAVRLLIEAQWMQAGYSACAALLNVFFVMGAK